MKFLSFIISMHLAGICAAEDGAYSLLEVKANNYRVSIIENLSLDVEFNVKSLAKDNGDIVINGGYYSKNYKPSGYCKINGQEITPVVDATLSGMLFIDENGLLGINWSNGLLVAKYKSIIQNGPFLIDPGGKLGINSDDGKLANRACIGRKSDGNVVLVYSPRITLFKLASAVLEKHSDVVELLNMDGGPMAGLWVNENNGFQYKNSVPAIYYVKLSKEQQNEAR